MITWDKQLKGKESGVGKAWALARGLLYNPGTGNWKLMIYDFTMGVFGRDENGTFWPRLFPGFSLFY